MGVFQKQDDSFVIGEDDLVLKTELMDWLHVSLTTVQRWMREGMPYTRFKNCVVFDKDEVDKWMQKEGYGPAEVYVRWKLQQKKHKTESEEK